MKVLSLVVFLTLLGAVMARPTRHQASSARVRADRIRETFSRGFSRVASREADEDWAADHAVCFGGRAYVPAYNVTVPTAEHFVRLDTAPGFHSVVCNVDHTDLLVTFTSAAAAQGFAADLRQAGPTGAVLTGAQGLAECEENYGLFRRVSRVYDSSVAREVVLDSGATGFTVRARVFKASYDQTLQEGEVKFGAATITSKAHARCLAVVAQKKAQHLGDPATFCMGINTNDQCNGAKSPLSFYSNSYVSVTCPECYLAFDLTIGLNLKMKDFLLYDAQLLLTDMNIQGDLQALMTAQYNWGVNGDATVPIVAPKNIIQFWVGPIPVTVGFELPLKKTAEASFSASGTAKAGAQVDWNIGHIEINWDPVLGFTKHVTQPTLKYTTDVSGQAQFQGSASFGLAPSLSVHLDDFVHANVDFDASVSTNVQGNTQQAQICASGSYQLSADSSAELYIAIPWVDIAHDWKWAETWFNLNGDLQQKCVSAKNITTPRILPQKMVPEVPSKTTSNSKRVIAAPARAPLADAAPVTRFTGSAPACLGNRGVRTSYDVSIPSEFKFIDLQDSAFDVKKIDCNAGGNQLRIAFHHDSGKDAFKSQAEIMNSFVTAQNAPDILPRCAALLETKIFMMRVIEVKDTSIPLIVHQLDVSIAQGRYDEVFSNATISVGADPSLSCREGMLMSDHTARHFVDGKLAATRARKQAPQKALVSGSANSTKHVCLGVNTNSACNAAKETIPLYSNEFMSIDCADCYAALQADIFFNMMVKDFTLESLQGGFKNIAVDAALVAKATSSKQWNAGTSNNTMVVAPTTILSFAVGPVPIRLWFELPLEKVSQVQAQEQASFSAGLLAAIPIGDVYVQWNAGKWTAVHPTALPKVQLTPQISAPSGQFSASGSLAYTPSFAFHVDSVFGTTFTLTPEISFNVNASLATKKACLESTVQLSGTGSAYLDVNVPFALFHMGGDWPKTTLFSEHRTLENKCISF